MDTRTIELKVTRNSCHQWIFKKMLKPAPRGMNRATIVRVVDRSGAFVGIGIFNPRSSIGVRLFTYSNEPVDAHFFSKRLAALKALREERLRLTESSDCYRLVHSESDGFPGLVIDRFNDHIMIKPYCGGYGGEVMDWIAGSLTTLYPGICVMVDPDEKSCAKDDSNYTPEMKKYPAKGRTEVSEFGVRFAVDFSTGQKTGFFLDQKMNRRTAAAMSRGLSVLDLCCYTGGFGVSMKKAGAASVTCVDLDADALELLKKNARANGCDVTAVHMNVFDFLRRAVEKREKYDMIILDPAKLAGNKLELPRAYRTYGDLNKLAISCVSDGGFLFTFSCSGLVSEKIFQSVVFNSSREAGALLKVLSTVGPSPDHPFSSSFPEGRYLKGILAQVEQNAPIIMRKKKEGASDDEEPSFDD